MNECKERYAVVDLEATDASITGSIIQIGIVIIESDNIIKTYETNINPHQPLSESIKSLTGLADHDLAKAPDFSQVAAEIYHLLADCYFVAHNVTFDANLLAEHLFLEGYELKTPRIDTVELAQVFFPTLERYSLAHLSQELCLSLKAPHTAIADAMATAQLFILICQKIKNIPRQALEKISCFSDGLLFETGQLITNLLPRTAIKSEGYVEVAGLLVKKAKQEVTKQKTFSQDMAINLALLGLKERSCQLDLIRGIQSLSQQKTHFIQAPSGLGKTYAYLLALLTKTTDSLVVFLPTKLLQEQVMANEAQQLYQQFGITFSSIKAASNYLNLDAFQRILSEPSQNRMVKRYHMQVLVWLLETETGDLDEIKQKQRYQSYFDQLYHTGQQDATSPFAEIDFWRLAQQAARAARVVITNHAYGIRCCQKRSDLLVDRHLVVDEAHRFFLALEAAHQQTLLLDELLKQLRTYHQQEASLLHQRLVESLLFTLEEITLCDKPSVLDQTRLEDVLRDLQELALEALAPVLAFFQEKEAYYWLDDKDGQSVIKRSSTSLTPFQTYLPLFKQVYFLSAQLTISKDVSLSQLLGLSQVDTLTIAPSFYHNQKIWLDTTMPNPQDLSLDVYVDCLASRIIQLSQLALPTLVLCPSKSLLLALSQRLSQHQLEHLVQGDSRHLFRLKRRFESMTSPLLLATGAFWEGVDLAGFDRSLLVIARLPFTQPVDLLSQKVGRALEMKSHQRFKTYDFPMMLMRLQQGIMRLLRRDNQQSAVLILDGRLQSKSYGRQIQQVLAEHRLVCQKNFAEIPADIIDFLL